MDRAMSVGPGTGMDMPIMHDSDRYDFVRDIGSGNFGVARLMTDKQTKELVAVKYIERGDKLWNGVGAPKRFPNSVEIGHDSDQYEYIRDIGSGNFGVVRLMKNKQSDGQVAIKYI